MIDVVFLLLVFFMLASRFGADMQVPLQLAGQGGEYSGPPRLVDVQPEGILLNGVLVDEAALLAGLEELTEAPTDTIILRARDEATLQRVVAIMEALGSAGYSALVLVE
ncbi:MAG: biopolymer transporter ExbD, partial [Pseudomonadota bacterium]